MDRIILTTKDADWIANIIRTQLNDLENAYKETKVEGDKRTEEALMVAKTIFPESEYQQKCQELNAVRDKALAGLEQRYRSKYANYSRILELMMTGSVI